MNPSFDLDAAIVTWRQEFAPHEAFSAADFAELETHLRDSIDDLRTRGLSDEEAFLVARHRLGSEELAIEMSEVHRNRLWIGRTRWMIVGVLGYYTLTSMLLFVQSAIQIGSSVLFQSALAMQASAIITTVLTVGVVAWIAFKIAAGSWKMKIVEKLHSLDRPWILLLFIFALFIASRGLQLVHQVLSVHLLRVEELTQVFIVTRWLPGIQLALILTLFVFVSNRAKQAMEG